MLTNCGLSQLKSGCLETWHTRLRSFCTFGTLPARRWRACASSRVWRFRTWRTCLWAPSTRRSTRCWSRLRPWQATITPRTWATCSWSTRPGPSPLCGPSASHSSMSELKRKSKSLVRATNRSYLNWSTQKTCLRCSEVNAPVPTKAAATSLMQVHGTISWKLLHSAQNTKARLLHKKRLRSKHLNLISLLLSNS